MADALMNSLIVVEYDPGWVATFERLRDRIWPSLADIAAAIEHVGSTSVPGLAAKPIVDMTVVVPAIADVPIGIERLTTLGYTHQGDLGIAGREAFDAPPSLPRHHLYLCSSDSLALRNHLAVRDYLRTHADVRRQYAALKQQLAREYPEDRDAYTRGKTDLVLDILRASGLPDGDLEAIRQVNP